MRSRKLSFSFGNFHQRESGRGPRHCCVCLFRVQAQPQTCGLRAFPAGPIRERTNRRARRTRALCRTPTSSRDRRIRPTRRRRAWRRGRRMGSETCRGEGGAQGGGTVSLWGQGRRSADRLEGRRTSPGGCWLVCRRRGARRRWRGSGRNHQEEAQFPERGSRTRANPSNHGTVEASRRSRGDAPLRCVLRCAFWSGAEDENRAGVEDAHSELRDRKSVV